MPPAKDRTAIGKPVRQSIMRFMANAHVAETLAEEAWNLLVAMAANGSNPAMNKAGSVSRPPPPAMASKKPARNATVANTKVRLIQVPLESLPSATYDQWVVLYNERSGVRRVAEKSYEQPSVVLYYFSSMQGSAVIYQECSCGSQHELVNIGRLQ